MIIVAQIECWKLEGSGAIPHFGKEYDYCDYAKYVEESPSYLIAWVKFLVDIPQITLSFSFISKNTLSRNHGFDFPLVMENSASDR